MRDRKVAPILVNEKTKVKVALSVAWGESSSNGTNTESSLENVSANSNAEASNVAASNVAADRNVAEANRNVAEADENVCAAMESMLDILAVDKEHENSEIRFKGGMENDRLDVIRTPRSLNGSVSSNEGSVAKRKKRDSMFEEIRPPKEDVAQKDLPANGRLKFKEVEDFSSRKIVSSRIATGMQTMRRMRKGFFVNMTLDVWNQTFWWMLWSMVVIRISTIVFLWYMIYWFVNVQWRDNSSSTFWIAVSSLSFLVLSLVHMIGLFDLMQAYLIFKGEIEAVKSSLLANEKRQSVIIDAAGLLMQFRAFRGKLKRYSRKYKSLPAILRLFMAIPIRTASAAIASGKIVDRTYLGILFVGLIVNGIITPVLLLSKNMFVRRIVAVYVDAMFDVFFSLILPLQFTIRHLIALSYMDIRLASSWELSIKDVVTKKVIEIDSPMRSFVFVVPFVMYHVALREVAFAMAKDIADFQRQRRLSCEIRMAVEESKHGNRRSITEKIEAATTKRKELNPILKIKFVDNFPAVTYGAAILTSIFTLIISVASLLALFSTRCPSHCNVPISKLFTWSGRCYCMAWNLDCNYLDIHTHEQVNDYILTIPETVFVMRIRNCPITDIPFNMHPRFSEILLLEIFNTSLVDFSLIPTLHFPLLRGLSIVKAPMSVIPVNVFALPSDCNEVRLSYTNISSFNPRISVLHLQIPRLFLEYNQFTTMPPKLSTFRVIFLVSLSGNPIEELSPVSLPRAIEYLFIGNAKLQQLPSNLFQILPNLRSVHLDNNNISSLPPSVTQGFSKMEAVDLAHNPVCNSTQSKSWPKPYCRNNCNPICQDIFFVQNTHCNIECNTSSCAFDGGDCLF